MERERYVRIKERDHAAEIGVFQVVPPYNQMVNNEDPMGLRCKGNNPKEIKGAREQTTPAIFAKSPHQSIHRSIKDK